MEDISMDNLFELYQDRQKWESTELGSSPQCSLFFYFYLESLSNHSSDSPSGNQLSPEFGRLSPGGSNWDFNRGGPLPDFALIGHVS